jgi:hypothetical protein
MKVRELIEILSEMDGEMEVCRNDAEYGGQTIDKVIVEELFEYVWNDNRPDIDPKGWSYNEVSRQVVLID